VITLPDVTATLITDSAGVLNIGSGQVYKDSSGNVGIGTSSPSLRLEVGGSFGGIAISNTTTTSGTTNIQQSYSGGTAELRIGSNASSSTAAAMIVKTGDAGNVIFNGNLLVKSIVAPFGSAPGVALMNGANNGYLQTGTSSTASTTAAIFYNPNGVVGAINTSGSATSYVTSSDYRLKNTIAPMTGALAKVALLKPCTYKWNADDSAGEGFIAHELAEVVPECVTGEKDEVDAEGNPQYQGIDTSFLVATLTAAIQEQQAIILAQQTALTALTARVEALEAA